MTARVLLLATFFFMIFSPAYAACTKEDVDNIINVQTRKFGTGQPSSGRIFTEIASKLQMYHDYYAKKKLGMFIYRVLITNGQQRTGRTVCSCIVFSDSEENFPLVSLGGKWGVNARQNRTVDAMTLRVAPAMVPLIDTATVYAGYCPTNRVWRNTERTVLDGAYAAARAYAIKKGAPKEALPRKRPGT